MRTRCGRDISAPGRADAPFPISPFAQHRVMREIKLQRCDGDVAVAEVSDIRVFFGCAEREDAAVPVVPLATRTKALFIGIDPRTNALAADFHAGRVLIRAERRHVDARDMSSSQT